MSVDPMIETYNYANFGHGPDRSDFSAFRDHMKVGDKAPDFRAILLDSGQQVQLSDYWKDQDLLIEFGSLT